MVTDILIVEDDALVALDISEILEENGFNVIATASNGASALSIIEKEKPHFVLLDINLKNSISGIDIANIINKKYHIPFVYITAYADDQTLDEVVKTNPVGFIVKPFEERQILAAIKIGAFLFNKNNVSKQDITAETIRIYFPTLNSRESETLEQLVKGKSNKEIAETLFLSVNTIKGHLKILFTKLEISSRLEAVSVVLDRIK